jgi:hypothetical protein
MPELTSKSLFSGSGEPNPSDLGNAEISNFHSSVDSRLREQFKWKGKIAGAIGLILSPDNSKVINGVFLVRGSTGIKDIRITCDKIWNNSTRDITLNLALPSADIFRFDDGGLVSNYVSCSNLTHSFHTADGSMVLAADRELHSITDFSIRMICEVSNTSDGRRGIIVIYHILIFPASWAEIQENPDSRFGSFPGVKIAEGAFPLLPRPSAAWGCPVIPFLLPGVPFEQLDTAPTGKRLREAIGAIMRKAVRPATLANGAAVAARWDYVRTHPRELEGPLLVPQTTWPAPNTDDTEEQEGKTVCITFSVRLNHREIITGFN